MVLPLLSALRLYCPLLKGIRPFPPNSVPQSIHRNAALQSEKFQPDESPLPPLKCRLEGLRVSQKEEQRDDFLSQAQALHSSKSKETTHPQPMKRPARLLIDLPISSTVYESALPSNACLLSPRTAQKMLPLQLFEEANRQEEEERPLDPFHEELLSSYHPSTTKKRHLNVRCRLESSFHADLGRPANDLLFQMKRKNHKIFSIGHFLPFWGRKRDKIFRS